MLILSLQHTPKAKDTRLHQVVSSHGLTLHQYADDCQIYLTTLVEDAPADVGLSLAV